MLWREERKRERHKKNFIDLVKNKIDIIFSNEQEILSLIDSKSFDEAVLFSKEINKKIIITRGEKGSVSISNGKVVEYSAHKDLKIIDLTGAGDLFAAGYLHGYIDKLPLIDCLIRGTELSSKIIQQVGARIK